MDGQVKIQNWFIQYRNYFKIELNGFSNPPILSYLSILPLIDIPGSILDVGSGNGMLLKFIAEFAKYKPIPFGIDINEQAIMMAQKEVFPQFACNFKNADLDTCLPLNRTYDIIICNPFHSKRSFGELMAYYLKAISNYGKIIIRVHDDVLINGAIQNLEDYCGNSPYKINYSKAIDVSYGIILKGRNKSL